MPVIRATLFGSLLLCTAGCVAAEPTDDKRTETDVDIDATQRVVIETALGDIELTLFPHRAPVTVANFLAYVDGGRFDGASFYRVLRPDNDVRQPSIEVVQGGLLGDLYHSAESVEDLFASQTPPLPPIVHETTDRTGIPNDYGVIAMGRLAPGTASSEFFVNLADNPVLNTGNVDRVADGKGYASFGRVSKGMALLERIQDMPTDAPKPLEAVQNQVLNEPVLIHRVYRKR